MTQWNHRLFPYPLLARWNDDYGERTFGARLEGIQSNKRKINLGIEFINGSEYLTGLVAEGSALYILVVSCPATAAREVITSPFETTIYELDATEFSKELQSTPYIVATKKLTCFMSDEHAFEFTHAVPVGFDVPAGSILAAGVSIRTPLEGDGDAASVIDLIQSDRVPEHELVVELDQERIKIVLNPTDRARVEKLRELPETSREMSLLYSALYLPTVAEAVRNLPDYVDRRWAVVLRGALEKHDIDVDNDRVKEEAFKHAQVLLNLPIGRSLAAFADAEDGEE